ncbi:sorting nexin lst-4 [Drosophila sechellia]|uniref:Sorting nexin n=1 Tax=Drosophila sechellia TaxID=7238 RepID=B4HL95_DROSE|nr:sorting nexin lst-4 [Drosophila sechellia]EDW40914.1 GM24848 [Drosophila sechellia]
MTSYVRAMYDFTGEPGSSELSIATGDVLSVTRSDVGEGWWEGKNARGQIGLFPAAYVEVMSAAEAQKLSASGTTSVPQVPDPFASPPLPRYDQTADDDGSNWDDEDDWSDDNDTYSEIGPGGQKSAGQSARAGGLSHSTSDYDNKHLPIAPNDDTQSLASVAGGTGAAGTVKKGMFAKSSDSYILGLSSTKEKIPECEMAYITQVEDSIYQWTQNHSPYSVVVASPKKESKFKGMKTFIAYQLTPSFNNISVSRRYKHFDWLHERLVDKFCLIPVPPLPDKQISGRYEEQFVEHRRVQLQEFVDWVCRHPVISKCEVWYHFLTCRDEKIWKSGKRKAERDPYMGVNYCLAISPPDKNLLHSKVDAQVELGTQFIHSMDVAVRNLNNISNDMAKRSMSQSKKEFQRIGDGLSDLAKALAIDERRAPTRNAVPLSESVGRIGGIFIGIGQAFGDQPKHDWIPLSDRLHIYRGVLNCFPDIFSTHKGAIQKRKDCEKLAGEGRMNNPQLHDVNRRTDVVSYTVLAELTHFKSERDTHLKHTLKNFIAEQIKFYQGVVARLQEASRQIE